MADSARSMGFAEKWSTQASSSEVNSGEEAGGPVDVVGPGRHRGSDPFDRSLTQVCEQVGLVVEVLEQAALGHAGGSGDDVEAPPREAVLRELGLGRSEHRRAALLRQSIPGLGGHGSLSMRRRTRGR